MAMNAAALAAELTVGMGFPLPASTELQGFATGLINGLKSGTAAFGPPTGNKITGLNGASIASAIAAGAGYGSVSSELAGFGKAFADYIQAFAIVTYTGPGGIPGFFLGGTISGISGSSYATLTATEAGFPSVSAELLAFGNAVMGHIVANAEVNAGVIT